MQELVEQVYTKLKDYTGTMESVKTNYNNVEATIKSGRFKEEVVKKELEPQLRELRSEMALCEEEALQEVIDTVHAWQESKRDEDQLHPEELTDDIKLFTAGISLSERDIKAILKRNADNKTMQQIALRYAQEHNIPVDFRFQGNQVLIQQSEELVNAARYYCKNWIRSDKARDMLNKFFNK